MDLTHSTRKIEIEAGTQGGTMRLELNESWLRNCVGNLFFDFPGLNCFSVVEITQSHITN
jgi:hypothetical protein